VTIYGTIASGEGVGREIVMNGRHVPKVVDSMFEEEEGEKPEMWK